MLRNVTYFLIFGKPFIMYLGITVLLSFSITALLGYLFHHGYQKFPFSWHPKMACISLTLATVHGFLGILAYI